MAYHHGFFHMGLHTFLDAELASAFAVGATSGLLIGVVIAVGVVALLEAAHYTTNTFGMDEKDCKLAEWDNIDNKIEMLKEKPLPADEIVKLRELVDLCF